MISTFWIIVVDWWCFRSFKQTHTKHHRPCFESSIDSGGSAHPIQRGINTVRTLVEHGKMGSDHQWLEPSKTMAGFYNTGVFPPHHHSALRDMLRDQEAILLRSKSSRRASKMSIKPNQHREFYQISTCLMRKKRIDRAWGFPRFPTVSMSQIRFYFTRKGTESTIETAIWPSISWICRKKPKTWDIPLTKRDQLVRFQQKILIWSDMCCI